jgi:hypothetical protein
MKKLLIGALAVAIVVAGCTAAAHLKSLQPRHPRISAAAPVKVPESVLVGQPKFQRGIDVDAYTWRGHDFSAAAAAVVKYAKSLHANSLSISFPFFMGGRFSSRVYATNRTPSALELSLLIVKAEDAGMYVSLRPLLSETNLGPKHSRVIWQPANPEAWFDSYEHFLLPYAEMAQVNHVGEFIVGAEFAQFGNSPLWDRLDQALRKKFHGLLAYSNNDTSHLTAVTGGRYAFKAIDAYHPIHPPFLSGWKRWDRRALPAGTVITEVGISAIDGAWRRPWVHRSGTVRIDPQFQARWFAAACQAAIASGLKGIYFWTLPLSTQFPGPTPATPGAWAHSPASAAIANCFGHAP